MGSYRSDPLACVFLFCRRFRGAPSHILAHYAWIQLYLLEGTISLIDDRLLITLLQIIYQMFKAIEKKKHILC